MEPEENFSQLSLWVVNLCPKSDLTYYTFCLYFIYSFMCGSGSVLGIPVPGTDLQHWVVPYLYIIHSLTFLVWLVSIMPTRQFLQIEFWFQRLHSYILVFNLYT